MSRSARQALLRALGSLAAVLLLWVAFRDVDVRRAISPLLHLGTLGLALFVPSVLAVSCETFAWQRAIAKMAAPVRFTAIFRIRVTSESLATVLPLGALWAEAARPPLLARYGRLTLGEGVASVAARKYLLVLSQAAYLSCGFFAGRAILESGFRRVVGVHGLSAVPLVCAIILFGVAEISALAFRGGAALRTLLDLASRIPNVPLHAALVSLRAGSARSDRAAARFFGASTTTRFALAVPCFIGWLIEATETWIFLSALGAHVSWSEALAVETVVVLGRHVFVMVPGGLGVLELGYSTFFVGERASLDVCAAFIVLKRLREAAWAAVGYLLWTFDRRFVSGK